MEIIRNLVLKGSHQKDIGLDLYYLKKETPAPIVIFSHGFKGFKDWGHWDLVARAFAEAGFCFIKFNFSHNGTTIEDPENFGDLEAFGHNNFSLELDDLGVVIDWVTANEQAQKYSLDSESLFLIGHSRGGGTTILKAAEDKRVKKIATWAAVHDMGRLFGSGDENSMKHWEKEGVLYIPNARTKQEMPLYWQLAEDFKKNFDRLDIASRAKEISIPALIAHGKQDFSVPFVSAMEIDEWIPNSKLLPIEEGNHTFGGTHPWESDSLAKDCQQVVDETVSFFKAS